MNIKSMALGLLISVAAPLSLVAVSYAKDRAAAVPAGLSKEEAQKYKEHMAVRNHIEKHVKYPATKAEVLTACKGMREVKASDKKWIEETLSDKSYGSAEDVETALGWEKATPAASEKK